MSGPNNSQHNLDAASIRDFGQLTMPLQVNDNVSSTQTLAKSYLQTRPKTGGAAFIANEQTKGQGRHGRSFYSPKDSGLYLSVVLPKENVDLTQVGLLTTGIADATANVLEQFFPTEHFMLKWVNDVLLNGRKVAGILTEAVFDRSEATKASFIVGIGLNLTTSAFPAAIKPLAGAIATTSIDRNRLAAALINACITCTKSYPNAAFLPDYRRRSVLLGRTVTLDLGSNQITGQVTGIADNGGLILTDRASRQHTYTSGEVIKVHY